MSTFEDETAFPRGGHRAPPSTTTETKKRSSDFLFGKPESTDGSKKKKKRRKSTPSTSTTSLLPVGGGGVQQPHHKKEALIETLSFSKLAKGTKLLGIIKEVHEDYAIVSLPNLLNGYILKREKDPYSLEDSFHVNQVLAVVVVKVSTESIPGGGGGTRKRIQVSALPSGLNSIDLSGHVVVRGRITSVEDHGCLVDLGHHKTGFLSFDNVDGDYSLNASENEEDESVRLLNPGRIYDFSIKDKHSTTNVVPLSLPSIDKLSRKTLNAGDSYTLETLNPGMLVSARVEALARNGLCVVFHGNAFRGSIELSHLGASFLPTNKQQDGSVEWKDVFAHKQFQKFPARILAVDSITKVVRLSLLPHLLDMQVCSESLFPPVGTVVENATVVRLDPGVGALLALPSDDSDSTDAPKLWEPFSKHKAYSNASKVKTAYVHISKALDGRTPEAEFSKTFAPSTPHTLRILNTSHVLDNVATCATADSIVQAHVLTHADLQPGQVYRGVQVCGQLQGGSVMVDFGMGIRGLIPQMHLFDHASSGNSEFRGRVLKEKYAIGQKVDVLCLSVDAPHKRCLVSAKKSLIKSAASDSVITSYESLSPNQTATGFISKIDDKGLCVTFCNRVYGKVTAKSLAAELGVQDHRADYHLGDVVACRVINCKKRSNARNQWDLNLSLNLQRDDDNDEEMEDAGSERQEKSRQVQLQAGAVLPENCMRVVEIASSIPKENGAYIPGHAIVRIKSKFLVKKDSAKMLPHVECKLPFDHLLDSYSDKQIESAETLDALAKSILTVGKKIDQRGLVLSDPKKSTDEYASGLGRLPIVSLRPKLIATAEAPKDGDNSYSSPLLPTEDTHLFMGAIVQGYVTQVNPRHGSFVRFLNRVTGLVPKVKKGLNLPKYGTVTCRIVALDVSSSPPKILLTLASSKDRKKEAKKPSLPPSLSIKPGDTIKNAEVIDCDFHRARVKFEGSDKDVRARIHVTMADAPLLSSSIQSNGKKHKKQTKVTERNITKHHPFYKWKKGTKLSNLTCVAVDIRDGVAFVELTNRDLTKQAEQSSGIRAPLTFLESTSELLPGMKLPGVITSVPKRNIGVWVQLSPGISGFIPALELSTDAVVVNNLSAYYPLGSRIECCVMEKEHWTKTKRRAHGEHDDDDKSKKHDHDVVFLSSLQASEMESGDSFAPISKPLRGDLIVGRVNRHVQQQRAPALMLDLRGGFVGRCCITELDEVDEWVNMPLGRVQHTHPQAKPEDQIIVTDEEEHDVDKMEVDDDVSDEESRVTSSVPDTYTNGTYVQCRVLAGVPSEPVVEVSLRPSRLEGDLDDDELPSEKDMVQGYVVDTNKKGCFIRLSRQTEGRVILKELADGFLHDPIASFPMGRLVVGKVKSIQEQKSSKKKRKTKGFVKATVDLDMRESTLLESQDKLEFDDIELQTKHKAVVTRLESYGVFVRLENSNVSGLVHKSECSDKFIKNLADLYDPGDLVKVLVVKKDTDGRKLGFSMKASHFEDDEDSEDESLDGDDDSDSDEEMADALVSDEADDTGDELDSGDENFASKLAAKMETEEAKKGDESHDSNDSSGSDSSSGDSSSDDDSDSDSESDDEDNEKPALDTNVGFDWGTGSASSDKAAKDESSDDSSDESSDEDDDSDGPGKSSHKSKRKAAARRREELEISRREAALADGTADENPETATDFERLLASEPNRSEHWIRYMAYHLSLADIASARNVAQRAFDRIEFRQEGEKLNVWTALLTLEHKYGTPKSFQETIDKACQHNNPKQVYLRVCEILEKEIDNAPSSTEAVTRADAMYAKMCKKFRTKKTVWLQHLHYLLKGGRHQEAHALLKRALTSLKEYKHVEIMSKFAQLEMEHGSMERGRTIMDGLLSKYPKRLDLLFVYVDKEVKHGELNSARALFEREHHKLSDKQMKSLFKKWYRIEEEHGTDESREHVKDAARAYVERSSNRE